MATKKKPERVLDALPDTVDFRDTMYIPTLVEVPPMSDLEKYRALQVPVLDQGREGACTGFGLATVANYLFRSLKSGGNAGPVSARMLYAMAKRYDEWPGENYEGSSARGAMKGWHKHGVCAERIWLEQQPNDPTIAADAIKRPLGAYFRVNHKDLVAMHASISEVGILYATARVHAGWMNVRPRDEDIRQSPEIVGGHAFAIVGYDHKGFWLQNSWGPGWASGGLVRLSYGDWLLNGTDVWVARLGVPVDLSQPESTAMIRTGAPRSYESYIYASLRPHVVVAENNGALVEKGAYGLTPEGLKNTIREQLPKKIASWKKKRVLLYAHGGLVPQDFAIQYAANYREAALKAEVYPISFIWRSDAWSTIGNILKDAVAGRRDEGILDAAKDFMLDRLDDTLEPLARLLGGKALWGEMKENAVLATNSSRGAAKLAAKHLIELVKAKKIDEIHLVGHSAGSIFHAHLAQFLADNKVPIGSLSLWAPACTIELFNEIYAPLIEKRAIEAFDLYTLDDATEQADDCRNIYHKSLLYLVSAAFEANPRIPLIQDDGTPLLGLTRDVKRNIPARFWNKTRCRWYVSPAAPESNARHHGGFDDDAATLRSTLRRITGEAALEPLVERGRPAGKTRRTRQNLDLALRRAS